MALTKLDDNTATIYNNEKSRLENIKNGCSIKIDKDYVDFLIPCDGKDQDIKKALRFSKIDLRKLLEELYIS